MLPHEFPRFKMFGRGEVPRFRARRPAGGPDRAAAGWLETPRLRPARSRGPPPQRPVAERSSGPPRQSPGAGGPGATPARSAGSRKSRPSPRSAAGHDRLNQLRQTTPHSATPGPPRRPSTQRPATSRPGGAVARLTRHRRPPATRAAQPASGATNQPWCQRPGVSLRWAVDGGVWKGLVLRGGSLGLDV